MAQLTFTCTRCGYEKRAASTEQEIEATIYSFHSMEECTCGSTDFNTRVDQDRTTYKGCEVVRVPRPYTRWAAFEWAHEDYDGPGDQRCGYGLTLEDCKEQIDELDEEGSL